VPASGPDPVTTTDDEEQIRALVVGYAERLDAGDLDGVAALFARGRFRSARRGAALVGADAVRAMYDTVVLYDDGTPRTKHVLGNLAVEVAPDRSLATASCTFVVVQASDGGPRPVLAGRYVDRFARHSDGWAYEERVVEPDLIGDLTTHMRRP
jgi:ketosteroid isomerase-like protein